MFAALFRPRLTLVCARQLTLRQFATASQANRPSLFRTDAPDATALHKNYQLSVYKFIREKYAPEIPDTTNSNPYEHPDELSPQFKQLLTITNGSESEVETALINAHSPFNILEALAWKGIKPTLQTYRILASHYYNLRETGELQLLRAFWVADGFSSAEIFEKDPHLSPHEGNIFRTKQTLAHAQNILVLHHFKLAAEESILRVSLEDAKAGKDLLSQASELLKQSNASGNADQTKRAAQIREERKTIAGKQNSLRMHQNTVEALVPNALKLFMAKFLKKPGQEDHKVAAGKKIKHINRVEMVPIDYLNPYDVEFQLRYVEYQIGSLIQTIQAEEAQSSKGEKQLQKRIQTAKEILHSYNHYKSHVKPKS